MSIETQVIWNLPMAQETIDIIEAKAQELIAEGKEVGNAIINKENNQTIVNRFWIDTETAQGWIAFVNTYNPASAVILN